MLRYIWLNVWMVVSVVVWFEVMSVFFVMVDVLMCLEMGVCICVYLRFMCVDLSVVLLVVMFVVFV